jgi:hypothetical protein
MNKPVYTIRAERWNDWWSLVVPDLSGVASQTRRLDQAEAAIQEVIEQLYDRSPDSYDLELAIADAEITELVEIARESRAVIERLTQQSRAMQAEAVERLRRRGLPMRDIGDLLGVSHQRIAQIERPSDAEWKSDDVFIMLEYFTRLAKTDAAFENVSARYRSALSGDATPPLLRVYKVAGPGPGGVRSAKSKV